MVKTQIIRALGEGHYEVQQGRRRLVVRLKQCVECERIRQDHLFPAHGRGLCRECYYGPTKEREEAQKKIRLRADKIKNLNDRAKKRAATLALASPSWRDVGSIRAIYDEARRLTAETGVAHHVDHYYPLQGEYCCGLHVHHNLRVMRASENCSKNNAHPLEDAPALRAFIAEYGQSGLSQWLRWARGELKYRDSKK